jgi:hypothetical protein
MASTLPESLKPKEKMPIWEPLGRGAGAVSPNQRPFPSKQLSDLCMTPEK